MSLVTGVRAEFIQATGYKLAGFAETAVAFRGFHNFALEFVWSESKETLPRERAVNVGRTKRGRDLTQKQEKPPSGGFSNDVSNWISCASRNSASCHLMLRVRPFDREMLRAVRVGPMGSISNAVLIGRGHGVPTCRSPAVRTALHVLRTLKLPSVALHVVECTFQRGFDSFRSHQPLDSTTYRKYPLPNESPSLLSLMSDH